MTTWTYKAVFLTPIPPDRTGLDAWLTEMNAYGAEGWEAFNIIPQESGWWTMFRRPAQEDLSGRGRGTVGKRKRG
jgi:hypothetical protein